MSTGKPFDASEFFQEWINQWERSVDSFSNKLMETDDFSRAVNSVQNTQLQMQKVFAEMMAKNLANLNMPSRDDVQELIEAVHGLEKRCTSIELQLKTLSGTIEGGVTSKPKGPPRTKRATKPKSKAKSG